jgi:hypothetical protein
MTEKIQAIEKQPQQQLCIFPESRKQQLCIFPESRKQQRTTKLLKTTKTCELLKTEEDILCVICKFGLAIISPSPPIRRRIDVFMWAPF